MTAPATLDYATLLDRYRAGESDTALAEEHGLTRATLYHALRKFVGVTHDSGRARWHEIVRDRRQHQPRRAPPPRNGESPLPDDRDVPTLTLEDRAQAALNGMPWRCAWEGEDDAFYDPDGVRYVKATSRQRAHLLVEISIDGLPPLRLRRQQRKAGR